MYTLSVAAAALMLAVVFLPHTASVAAKQDAPWPQWAHSTYLSLSRPMWGLGLAWMALAMGSGHTYDNASVNVSDDGETKATSLLAASSSLPPKTTTRAASTKASTSLFAGRGLVTSFLSADIWVPLARLTYQAYLFHPMWLLLRQNNEDAKITYTDFWFANDFVGNVVFAFSFATIGWVLFEKPMMNLCFSFGRR
jgi:peptidoglycan/LPS O-acetylase OafA/YrhL